MDWNRVNEGRAGGDVAGKGQGSNDGHLHQ